MVIYVAYPVLEENFGGPVAVFTSKAELDYWMQHNKDSWGQDYCWDEFDPVQEVE